MLFRSLSENMGLIFGTRTRKKFYNREPRWKSLDGKSPRHPNGCPGAGFAETPPSLQGWRKIIGLSQHRDDPSRLRSVAGTLAQRPGDVVLPPYGQKQLPQGELAALPNLSPQRRGEKGPKIESRSLDRKSVV